jgi:hypothetical protein
VQVRKPLREVGAKSGVETLETLSRSEVFVAKSRDAERQVFFVDRANGCRALAAGREPARVEPATASEA